MRCQIWGLRIQGSPDMDLTSVTVPFPALTCRREQQSSSRFQHEIAKPGTLTAMWKRVLNFKF